MRTLEDTPVLEQWTRIVGPEHVITDTRELRSAETGTYATDVASVGRHLLAQTKTARGADGPDRDGCGLLWCSPVAPNDGFHAQQLTVLVTALLLRHGFEPMISITVLTDRTLSCVISISYDRDVAGEDERATACYRELLGELARMGYYCYRLSVGFMAATMGQPGPYTDVLRRIKQTLDPAGILAPGRYLS